MTRIIRPLGGRNLGRHIVRAWFDTVLNPLLQALSVERECLEKKDWTWRFIPGGLEAIRPVRAHVDVDARDNLEQFLELNPAAKTLIRVHDLNVTALSDKCGRLQSRLEHSPELLSLYKRVTSPAALSRMGASLEQLFGAYPPNDHIGLLSQYILNNTGDLPTYYATAPLWNKHKAEFLALLGHRFVKVDAARTAKAGQILLKGVELLFRQLKDLRLELSLGYDVPYVTARGSQLEGPLQ